MMKDEKALLRVNEFAAVLDVTSACVRRCLHERKIASTRIGRLVRIPRDEAMRLVFAGLLACLLSFSSQAQVSPAPTEFAVLRAGRVVESTENSHLDCSVIGLGDAAQISCDAHPAGSGVPLVSCRVSSRLKPGRLHRIIESACKPLQRFR